MKNLLILLSILIFNGCTQVNTYQQYYRGYNNAPNTYENNSTEPAIETNLNFNDIEQNRKKMYEDGYYSVGSSGFQGNREHSKFEDIQSLAKQVKAKKVLVYTKSLGQINSGSISTYVGYGVSVNTPLIVDRFEYFADFFREAKKRACGCSTIDLTDIMKKTINSNKGVMVQVIRKDSPAYSYDLLVGDLILKVNNIQIIDKKHFSELILKLQEKEVIFDIFRDGKYLTLKIKLEKDE